jgi:AcrR family transcriptional regulator
VDASAANRASSSPGLRPGIAERLWEASRVEFSLRGYHGARVQGIARRAGCNVALLYRHWSSKKALYIDVLRSFLQSILRDIDSLMGQGHGAPAVVGAYLDANMRDAIGAQIIVREILDRGPFLSQILAAEPAIMEPIRRTALALTGSANGDASAFRPGVDPLMAVLTIGGLSALVASAHEASRPFFKDEVTPDRWRQHIYDLLLHGILAPKASEST